MVRADCRHMSVDSKLENGNEASGIQEYAEGSGDALDWIDEKLLQHASLGAPGVSLPEIALSGSVHWILAQVRSQCFWIKMGMSKNARNLCVLIRALYARS